MKVSYPTRKKMVNVKELEYLIFIDIETIGTLKDRKSVG